VCTNEECQIAFDKNRATEIKKRDELKMRKEEQSKKRQDNIALSMAKKRESKAA